MLQLYVKFLFENCLKFVSHQQNKNNHQSIQNVFHTISWGTYTLPSTSTATMSKQSTAVWTKTSPQGCPRVAFAQSLRYLQLHLCVYSPINFHCCLLFCITTCGGVAPPVDGHVVCHAGGAVVAIWSRMWISSTTQSATLSSYTQHKWHMTDENGWCKTRKMVHCKIDKQLVC